MANLTPTYLNIARSGISWSQLRMGSPGCYASRNRALCSTRVPKHTGMLPCRDWRHCKIQMKFTLWKCCIAVPCICIVFRERIFLLLFFSALNVILRFMNQVLQTKLSYVKLEFCYLQKASWDYVSNFLLYIKRKAHFLIFLSRSRAF